LGCLQRVKTGEAVARSHRRRWRAAARGAVPVDRTEGRRPGLLDLTDRRVVSCGGGGGVSVAGAAPAASNCSDQSYLRWRNPGKIRCRQRSRLGLVAAVLLLVLWRSSCKVGRGCGTAEQRVRGGAGAELRRASS